MKVSLCLCLQGVFTGCSSSILSKSKVAVVMLIFEMETEVLGPEGTVIEWAWKSRFGALSTIPYATVYNFQSFYCVGKLKVEEHWLSWVTF